MVTPKVNSKTGFGYKEFSEEVIPGSKHMRKLVEGETVMAREPIHQNRDCCGQEGLGGPGWCASVG